jgi:hypothetical protein
MTDDLFREEAVRHRTRALYGDVLLAAPPKMWLITWLLATIALGVVLFAVFATIETASGAQPLWKWAFGIAK